MQKVATEKERVNWGKVLDDVWGKDPSDLQEELFIQHQSSLCRIADEVEEEITSDAQNFAGVRQRKKKAGGTVSMNVRFPIFSDDWDEILSIRGNKENRRKGVWKTELAPYREEAGMTKKQRTTTRRPVTTRRLHKKRRTISDNSCKAIQQMCLDFGQKNLGHVTCKVCGMVYTFGQAEDENEHAKFHKRYLAGVSFQGWKNERVAAEHFDGRIIVVHPSDPRHHLRKVEEIVALVDSELGYATGIRPWRATTKVILQVFLYTV